MELSGIPASVFIAQSIEETGWGTSELFATGNTLVGQSANDQQTAVVETITFPARGKKPSSAATIKYRYDWKQSGRYFARFNNALDSAYSYINRLLYDPAPSRQKAYAKVRQEVNSSLAKGKKADLNKIISALDSWSTNAGHYLKKLRAHVSDYNLSRFDHLTLCP